MNHSQMRKLIGVATLSLVAASCSEGDINISNPNSARPSAVSTDPTALQLLATGLMADQRSTRTGQITLTGILGREMYNFTTNEGRNTTNYIIGITVNGVQKLDPAGFANGGWTGQYGALRDVHEFIKTVNANPVLSPKAKGMAIGFAQTIGAMMVLEVAQTRDSVGGITEVLDDPLGIAPFVTRDSMYKYVLNTLDDAVTTIKAADTTAFPFKFVPGFQTAVAGAKFDDAAGFIKFNRAIKARAAVNYATLGGGTAAWQAALRAIDSSFINPAATSRAGLDVGVYDTYAASPDSPNGLSVATNTNLYAHMSIQRDAQKKADGVTPDDRYTAKIRTGLPTRSGPGTGASATSDTSNIGYNIWTTSSSPIAVIRNEELILLRAEAKLGTGDKPGAIADLNIVRQNSGGLPASTLTAASSDSAVIDGILYEKRYSLMMEGQRWPDARRYGRLGTLPLDITTGVNKNFVAKVVPVPQGECLVRAALSGALLGPNGQNNCAP